VKSGAAESPVLPVVPFEACLNKFTAAEVRRVLIRLSACLVRGDHLCDLLPFFELSCSCPAHLSHAA
jgi:hypothetical protein